MKKRLGSITITFIFFVTVLIAFFLAMFDFNRVANAKTVLNKHIENSMDLALANYDENLFKIYGIMAVPKNREPEKIVNSALEYSLKPEIKTWNTTSYKIENIEVKTNLDLENPDVIKLAIIKKHKKKFIANSLIHWTKKLDILKDMKTYSKIASIYGKTLRQISKLKSDFDKILKIQKKISSMAEEIKNLDITKTVNKIISTKKKIKELKEEYDELTEKISNLKKESTVEQKGKETNNVNATSKSDKIDKIKDFDKEKNEKNKNIESLEVELKTLNNNLDKIFKLIKEGNFLSEKIKDFSQKIKSKTDYIKSKLDSIEINNQAKSVVDITKKLLGSIERASEKIESISEKLNRKIKKGQEIITEINNALKTGHSLLNVDFSLNFDFANFLNFKEISDVFGKSLAKGVSTSIFKLLDRIWGVFSGEFIPDFSGLRNIEVGKYINLPSRKHNSKVHKERKIPRKPLIPLNLAEENMKSFETSSEEISQGSSLNVLDNIFDKLVISDYVVNTFSHYDHKSPKKTDLLGGAEVEYLLSGNANPAINLSITHFKIFAVRMVFNTISILSHKSGVIQSISTTLSSWTFFLAYPIVYGAVSLGWISMESLSDMREIVNGKSVVILKGKEDINISLTGNNINDMFDSIPSAKPIKESKISMNYKDFLMLFLVIENEEDTLIRISDLIKLKENIEPKDYITSIYLSAEFEIPRFFPNVESLFSNYSSKNKNSIVFSKVRGY